MGFLSDMWKPLSVDAVKEIFQDFSFSWWVAGGWALDLHIGKQTREHDDLDIVIFREHHRTLHRHLSKDWALYQAFKGTLIPWQHHEELPSHIDNLWVRDPNQHFWAFQIMILDSEDGMWLYKRKPTIRKSIEGIGNETHDGTPYLRPEIQLLYKGGSSKVRDKDYVDLYNTLPFLQREERNWLKDALYEQFPSGHQWIDYIKQKESEG